MPQASKTAATPWSPAPKPRRKRLDNLAGRTRPGPAGRTPRPGARRPTDPSDGRRRDARSREPTPDSASRRHRELLALARRHLDTRDRPARAKPTVVDLFSGAGGILPRVHPGRVRGRLRRRERRLGVGDLPHEPRPVADADPLRHRRGLRPVQQGPREGAEEEHSRPRRRPGRPSSTPACRSAASTAPRTGRRSDDRSSSATSGR